MPRFNKHLYFVLPACTLLAAFAHAQGGSRGAKNPFSAPDATIHYAPDRMYDLQNLLLDFNVDYDNRLFTATATNSIAALRDGTTQLLFNASNAIKIDSVELNGHPANYSRSDADDGIWVACPPTKVGEKDTVVIHYHGKKSEAPNGATGGWHWHEPKKNDPYKMGLFTNGETSDTRDWAVTWDYPNDFTSSETRTTVPKDWDVISNGLLVSNKVNSDGKTRTFDWKMDQTHATYLTSLVCGPYDIVKDKWRGKPLYYVSPKGMGSKLAYTCANTKDMLTFYSDNLGFEYPWTKYAEDFTYDFGGGQENVSNTTFGLFFADPRSGNGNTDSLLAHEMGHQWFGDYATCKDWGQIWLNESFATFMQMSYTLYSRGVYASQRDTEQNSQGYFDESKRYKRPMETNFYSNPGVMFDQHTYPKGGVLLMSLRKMLGNKVFYAGLQRYLQEHHGPVETNMLCNSMTDATGVNLHPWFDQWIEKPGHPVIDWSWSYDDAKHMVDVHVKQTQDTTQGTPIYDIPAQVGLVSADGTIARAPIHLNAADQTFEIPSSAKPGTVAFDPDHDFLRQIVSNPWAAEELPLIAQYAPNCIDRQYAFNKMLDTSPSDTIVQDAVTLLQKDKGFEPAIINVNALVNLKKPELRSFWESELTHDNFQRRAAAVTALGQLPADPAETAKIRGLVNDTAPYAVIAAAIKILGTTDYAASQGVIENQAKTSTNAVVKGAALNALLDNKAPDAVDIMFVALGETQPDEVQQAGMATLANFKGDDPRIVPAVRTGLNSGNFNMIFQAMGIARTRKIKEVIPDLEVLKKQFGFFASQIDAAIADINK
jgi:aminopeptidase N